MVTPRTLESWRFEADVRAKAVGADVACQICLRAIIGRRGSIKLRGPDDFTVLERYICKDCSDMAKAELTKWASHAHPAFPNRTDFPPVKYATKHRRPREIRRK